MTGDALREAMMRPTVKEPLSYQDAISKYPQQLKEIEAQIKRTESRVGRAQKPINTFAYPDDFIFYIRTMRIWTSIRKDGMVERKDIVSAMRKYDAVWSSFIEEKKIF